MLLCDIVEEHYKCRLFIFEKGFDLISFQGLFTDVITAFTASISFDRLYFHLYLS